MQRSLCIIHGISHAAHRGGEKEKKREEKKRSQEIGEQRGKGRGQEGEGGKGKREGTCWSQLSFFDGSTHVTGPEIISVVQKEGSTLVPPVKERKGGIGQERDMAGQSSMKWKEERAVMEVWMASLYG